MGWGEVTWQLVQVTWLYWRIDDIMHIGVEAWPNGREVGGVTSSWSRFVWRLAQMIQEGRGWRGDEEMGVVREFCGCGLHQYQPSDKTAVCCTACTRQQPARVQRARPETCGIRQSQWYQPSLYLWQQKSVNMRCYIVNVLASSGGK